MRFDLAYRVCDAMSVWCLPLVMADTLFAFGNIAGVPWCMVVHIVSAVKEAMSKQVSYFEQAVLALLQEVVTLRTDMVEDATASILEMHSIPAAVSKDLTGVLPVEQIANSSHQEAVTPAAAPS